VSVLAAAVVLADLCGAPPDPAPARDPADSVAYTAVGDDARAAGDPRTAALAYRKALALDPENPRAAAGLAALCGDASADDGAALLEAIARYRDGDHGAAGAALSDIVRTAGASSAGAGAHFFLGLIALEHHDTPAAVRELELARGDPDYRGLAAALLRLAHRDGAVAVALLVEPELDTNPQLLPDTPPSGAASGTPATDEDLLTVATVTARPAPWLAVRNALTWRNQRQLSALDFLADDLEIAGELADGRHRATIRYDLDYGVLDGARYLVANRGAIAYRHDGSVLAPVASYSLRRRDFLRDTEQAFTGWIHAADAGAIVHLGAGIDLDARATLGREITADASFANRSAGLRLVLRTRSTAPVRLIASASGGYARYDAAQPDGLLRSEIPLDASADVEVDLGDHVVAVAGAAIARNQSSIEDFRYAKLVARCGLVVAWGGL
jgi:tetratricopeptide (TPR) repeat protein